MSSHVACGRFPDNDARWGRHGHANGVNNKIPVQDIRIGVLGCRDVAICLALFRGFQWIGNNFRRRIRDDGLDSQFIFQFISLTRRIGNADAERMLASGQIRFQIRATGGPGDPSCITVDGHSRRRINQPVTQRITIGIGRLNLELIQPAGLGHCRCRRIV